MAQIIRVLAKPAFKVKNSSTSSCVCLYSVVRENGVHVIEWSPSKMMFSRYDVLHLHWPDNVLSDQSAAVGCAKMLLLFAALCWVKALGKKIVWTAHNLDSHEQNHPRLERVFWKIFPHFLDAILTPMYCIKEEVEKRPEFRCVKRVVTTPYGDWSGFFNEDKSVTKKLANKYAATHKQTVLWFGFIRRYKGLENLITEFSDPALSEVQLVIAGSCSHPEYEESIKSLVRQGSNVNADIRFIPDGEVASYFANADLCVFPFGAVTNSGSVRLALTFSRSVLVPNYPFAAEFQKEFGPRWITTYNAQKGLKAADVVSALAVLENSNKHDKISWGQYNWKTAAEKSIEVYRDLS